MDECQFLKYSPNKLGFKFPESFPFFFHTNFVTRNGKENLVTYAFKKRVDIIAFIHFHVSEGKAVSIPQNSFGGVAVISVVDIALFEDFLRWVIDDLKLNQVKQIEIRNCPNFYPNGSIMEEVFSKIGFQILYSNVNQFIEVDNKKFIRKINRNRRRNLSFCKKKGFTFKQLTLEKLDAIYFVLAKNRTFKGYKLSMSLKQLKSEFINFPNRYVLFGVFEEEIMIAAAVCIKVSSNILYDFYHGELPEYIEHSPVTMLVEGIYNYSIDNGYDLLDLGTSAIQGKLNEGVCQFKKSLGALLGWKITYQFNNV